MFTGIVEGRGKAATITPTGSFLRIGITTVMNLTDVVIGDSIAVDGVCLTVTGIDKAKGSFFADVSPETVRVTTLADMKPGSEFNLEKAMRLGARIGGHLVAGHVDCVGRMIEKRPTGVGFLLGFSVDSGRYLIEKGSVAIDGVSLTVNSVAADRFRVMIIPHTAGLTGLVDKKVNDKVNIEYDMIGKYVEKLFARGEKADGIDENRLKEYGFI
jgi:riboflavin synthase